MHRTLSLTVSESKRLIAKGITQNPQVRHALAKGTLAVLPGTTNGYVVEELTGKPFDKTTFVAGRTLPANYTGPKPDQTAGDLVMSRGQIVDTTARQALSEMGPGDVLIKGVNALNYERRQAGVLIGHQTGGNVGYALGTVVARRICYLLPVGLEKSVTWDLVETARRLDADHEGRGPTLWVVPGMIFTEIEAVRTLTGAEVIPVGAGGIGGAEGAVWLTVFGDKETVDKTEKLIESIRGEPPFLLRDGGSLPHPLQL